MKHFWLTLTLALTLSVLVGALFFVALRDHYPAWRTLHLVNTSLTGVMAMLGSVTTGLFVYSMRNFRQELRRAYALLCSGILLFGLAQVQFPIASYINAAFWYRNGFIAIPYTVAVISMFLGVRMAARILGIHTIWTSFAWLLGASIIIPALVALIPHARTDLTTAQLVGLNVMIALTAVFMAFVVMIVWRIRQVIGVRYVHAMTWLAAAFAANWAAGIHYIVVNLVTSRGQTWYYYDAMNAEPFFLGSALLVYAGYAMVMVGRSEEIVTTAAASDNLSTLANAITYLASLASKPQDIDPTLDALRTITARLNPSQPTSAEDEQQLITVYRKIEHYLTTDEPLRLYSQEELRKRLTDHFHFDPTVTTKLWNSSNEPNH